jgi:hypothetical protein
MSREIDHTCEAAHNVIVQLEILRSVKLSSTLSNGSLRIMGDLKMPDLRIIDAALPSTVKLVML